MCYNCTLCNRCGRADEMRERLGKRECPKCHQLEPDNDIRICTNCGAALPPPFPLPPEMMKGAGSWKPVPANPLT